MTGSNKKKSILIIGASGRLGLECLKVLKERPEKPAVHAFVRDPRKLQLKGNDAVAYDSVVQGDARSAKDLERALNATEAGVVIVSIGNGDSVKKSDIRTANAQALAEVLTKPQFNHVRMEVVSSTGAGSSRIIVGMGIGKLIEHHLRHVLFDHTGQERALKPLLHRGVIVRATALIDGQPTGKMVEFGDKSKGPSIKTDRHDLAQWIADDIFNKKKRGTVNLTSVKQ